MDKYIDENDFLVRIRPYKDESGEWSGDIDLSIVTLPDNDWSDEDYSELVHFATMVASTVPIMENNTDVRELVHNYVMDTLDTEYEPVVEDSKTTEVEYDGNIVKINFGTTTKGSA